MIPYEDNERFFAGQQTNRNYAGPLDIPWLEEGMSIVQWKWDNFIILPYQPITSQNVNAYGRSKPSLPQQQINDN